MRTLLLLILLLLTACGGTVRRPTYNYPNPQPIDIYAVKVDVFDSEEGHNSWACTGWSPAAGYVATAYHCAIKRGGGVLDTMRANGAFGSLAACKQVTSGAWRNGDGICIYSFSEVPVSPVPRYSTCAAEDTTIIPGFPAGEYREYYGEFDWYDGKTLETSSRVADGTSGAAIWCRGGVAGIALWAYGGGYDINEFTDWIEEVVSGRPVERGLDE